jgi:hypothetical protein
MIRPLWQMLSDEPENPDCDECFAVMEYWPELLAQVGSDLLPDIERYLVRCPDCRIKHCEALHRLETTIRTNNGVNT